MKIRHESTRLAAPDPGSRRDGPPVDGDVTAPIDRGAEPAPGDLADADLTDADFKLEKIQPRTVGQASRISGVSPADIAILLVWLKRGARAKSATSVDASI